MIGSGAAQVAEVKRRCSLTEMEFRNENLKPPYLHSQTVSIEVADIEILPARKAERSGLVSDNNAIGHDVIKEVESACCVN